jgi:hypothetical protein
VTPVSYYVPTEFSSPKFAFAFAKGCGGPITDERELFDGPVAFFGSPAMWPLLRKAQAAGRDWLFGDHGYFGNERNLRKRYFRITRNGYQHDGRGHATPARFERLQRPVQRWRKSGRHILVCPNSAVYFGLHGLNVDEWLVDVRQQLAAVTDRPIRIRWKVSATPIAEDLQDCWAVVVFSSSSAIDGLIAGVPCVTLAPFASTVRMGRTSLADIERPLYPSDREPFLWNLADHQWTLNEIFAGHAWRTLRETAHA